MPESLGAALGEATWAGLLSNHPIEVSQLAQRLYQLGATRASLSDSQSRPQIYLRFGVTASVLEIATQLNMAAGIATVAPCLSGNTQQEKTP